MKISHASRDIRRRLRAQIEVIEPLCDEVTEILSRRNWGAEAFPFTLLLRELLLNAILHGAKEFPQTRIRCRIFFGKSSLSLTVEDEGPGFPWRKKMKQPLNLKRESGRGLQILQKYAQKIHFNEQGNRIHVFRNVQKKNLSEVQQ